MKGWPTSEYLSNWRLYVPPPAPRRPPAPPSPRFTVYSDCRDNESIRKPVGSGFSTRAYVGCQTAPRLRPRVTPTPVGHAPNQSARPPKNTFCCAVAIDHLISFIRTRVQMVARHRAENVINYEVILEVAVPCAVMASRYV